jgi:putative salt-induced outer membrane protein YdiY
MKRYCLCLFLAACCALPGKADVAHFKNGDRLTGEWVRVEGDKIVFKTETLGEVQIPTEQLESFQSATPAVLLLKGGTSVRGKLALIPSGDWQVQTKTGKQWVAADSLQIIYPEETYKEKGLGHKPKPWENWKGKGALGYSLVRGDQSSRTLSVDFNATRRIPVVPYLNERSRTNYFLNMLFAHTQTPDGLRISANTFTSGVRQDFTFTPRDFWFLLAQFDHSDTQSLNLRQVYGGGLGHDLVKNSRVNLQLLGGVTFVKENFQLQVQRSNAEGLAGEKLSWKLTDWLGLDHFLSFYPNLTDRGNYRFDTSSTLSTKITSRLSFNTTFTDHFLSQPLPGRRQNEVILTTGLGVTF